MQRKASKLVFMSVGAALAWCFDPVSGSERRRQLTDQLSGLTGKVGPPSDPTGGAALPTMAAAPPPPTNPFDPPLPQSFGANEGALGDPLEPDDSRAGLRTW